MKLVDRQAECGTLDGLVQAVRAGESQALVLSGEPGVGKTALLQYLIREAAQCRVVQTAGVESEMDELGAAAALKQELQAVMEATGSNLAPYAPLVVAAMRGRPGEVSDLIDAVRSDLSQRGEWFGFR